MKKENGANQRAPVKVIAKNRPSREQASETLKELGAFLSRNWQTKSNNPLD